MTRPAAVRAWRPAVPGVREVFHARFDEHAYPRHTHDAWTVLIVDRGDIRFALDGRDHGSVTSTVTVLPPHVAHDGRAGRSGSFVKRVLYLDATYLDDGLIGHAVDQPTFVDASLRSALASAHHALAASVADAFAAGGPPHATLLTHPGDPRVRRPGAAPRSAAGAR